MSCLLYLLCKVYGGLVRKGLKIVVILAQGRDFERWIEVAGGLIRSLV